VSSRLGEGSEFRVSLPLAEADAASDAASPAQAAADYFSGPAWGQILTLEKPSL
jgi:hypothetical protein